MFALQPPIKSGHTITKIATSRIEANESENHLVRAYPFAGAPRIPKRLIDSEESVWETEKAIREKTAARAAEKGLREIRTSRTTLSKMFPGVPEILKASPLLVPDSAVAGLPHEWVADARLKAAKKYRDDAIRGFLVRKGFYRLRTLYGSNGHPSNLIFWLSQVSDDAMANHVQLAAYFDLEFALAAPYFFIESDFLALELCRGQMSILDGWGFGDLRHLDRNHIDDRNAGQDSET